MADDWDLFAVVRSCSTTSTATATVSDASTTSSTPTGAKSRKLGDPFVNSPSFQHDENTLCFPGINYKDDSFQGLDEIYKELCSDTRPNPSSFSSGSVQGEFHKIQVLQQQVQPHVQPQEVLESQNQHSHPRHSILGSSLSFPSPSPQPIRPRRRKNQQTKVIHQMTQEELSSDSWAWRKYGQKPIKGSPHPRNYYRCSTSKGCSARKQVERCPTDPNIFVVSYSGEHTHPPPTHRSSLAGSTRSKLSPAAKTTSSSAATSTAATITSSAARPTMEGESEGEENNTDEAPYIENDVAEVSGNIEEEEEEEEEGNDEEDILIPNTFITDEILKGFQELSGGGTNGSDSSGAIADQSSCSLLSPPWTPTSSTTSTNFAAGGGC